VAAVNVSAPARRGTTADIADELLPVLLRAPAEIGADVGRVAH